MLKGKTVVITGASRGIGKAILKLFSSNHANVFIMCRSFSEEFLQEIKELESKNEVTITPIECDLSVQDSIKCAVKNINKLEKKIDILINNAGTVADSSLFQMTSLEKMKNVFEVNFWGATLVTQLISRMMVKNSSGSIVFISSVAALDGTPAQYEYACSKAAVIGAVKELSVELGKFGIRVNAVAPGITDTDMAKHIEDGLKEHIIGTTALNRISKPEEIAQAVLFLSSDMSSCITGQILRADCGRA